MLTAERRRKIKLQIEREGIVEINQLSGQFGVSPMTIRRDLDYLEAQDQVIRTHGGAILKKSDNWEPPHKWKDEQHAEAKEAIARVAVKMITDGQKILLDAGSTNLRLAREMKHVRDVYVITNDVKIAVELGEVSGIGVLLTGGELKQTVFSLEGFYAESTLSTIHVDLAFIGCDAFDFTTGAMSNSLTKVKLKQLMLQNSQRKVLLADSSKLGQRALSTFAPLHGFDFIITDQGVPVEFRERCQQHGVEVIIADM